jgi:TctA family transporter
MHPAFSILFFTTLTGSAQGLVVALALASLLGVPMAPGFVLSQTFEEELRSAFMSSGGSIDELFDRPVALSFIAVAVFALAWPFRGRLLPARRTAP